jgi:hypothetical protein
MDNGVEYLVVMVDCQGKMRYMGKLGIEAFVGPTTSSPQNKRVKSEGQKRTWLIPRSLRGIAHGVGFASGSM